MTAATTAAPTPSAPTGMRRWIRRPGAEGVDALALEDAAVPAPGPGEVRVRLRAVSLNFRDQMLLSDAYGATDVPFVPIADGAGTIDALGEGVGGWAVGDRVVGNYFRSWYDGPPVAGQGWGLGTPAESGMLTEYAVLGADRVTRIARSLDFEQAATIPCAGLTAWTALRGDRPYRRDLREDDTILVLGTGAVSLFSLLLARTAGATVLATSSSPRKRALVEALGAAGTVDYRATPDWGRVVAQRTGGGVQLVVNAAGPGSLPQAVEALAFGGEVAQMGLMDDAQRPIDWGAVMMRSATIRGTAVGSAAAHADLMRALDEHPIEPPIAEVFAFEDARDAYRAQADPATFGKVVIRIAA
jgi:NADPH:quinone reductase-like Zn-dependent oxidoreductase